MNKYEFIEKFCANRLGRKKQCGNYYTVEINDLVFLMYYGDALWDDKPAMLAFRDPAGNVLVNEPDRGRFKGLPNIIATFDAETLDSKHDISQWRLLETFSAPCNICNLSMYEIDGARYITDMEYPVPGSTLDEVDNLLDFRHKSNEGLLTLRKAEGFPSSFKEARASYIPDEYRDSDGIFIGVGFLIPEDIVADYDEKLLETIKWKPEAIGWNIPSELRYRYSKNGSGVVPSVFSASEKEIRASYAEEANHILAFRKAFTTWNQAFSVIIAEQENREKSINPIDVPWNNRWTSNGNQYVKGAVSVLYPSSCQRNGDEKKTLNLQLKGWHRIVRFDKEEDE